MFLQKFSESFSSYFENFWKRTGHLTNFLVRKEFSHVFKMIFQVHQNFSVIAFNICKEFSQNFPHPETYFCKIYPKSPYTSSKYSHTSNKIFENIFIEIPFNLIKTNSKFCPNVIILKKFHLTYSFSRNF